MKDETIPIFYAVAMASDAIASLVLGKLFDKIGLWAVVTGTIIAVLFAPLVFWGGFYPALIGMILWGIGMGTQESILKAEVAKMIPPEKRGRAFGLFDTIFGVFWFIGSVLIGYLYDYSLTGLILFSIIGQLAAVCVLLKLSLARNKAYPANNTEQ
jgi:MFS-type transporter involved in bile tolerance (Atg22 family)